MSDEWRDALSTFDARSNIHGHGLFAVQSKDAFGVVLFPGVVLDKVSSNHNIEIVRFNSNDDYDIHMHKTMQFVNGLPCSTYVFAHIKLLQPEHRFTLSWLAHACKCDQLLLEKLWFEDISSMHCDLFVRHWGKYGWKDRYIWKKTDTIEQLLVQHDMHFHS